MIEISASIVLYKNDLSVLERTISNFLETNLNVRLYLIDNSPTDCLKLLVNDKRITYLHNPINPGFGAAHNMAIIESYKLNSQYHLVLNPDIYFETGTLEKIFYFMNENKFIGQLMPKVLFPDGSFQFLCKTNPTVFDLFLRGFLPPAIKNLFKNRINKYEYRNHDLNKIIYDIPYLSGCFMFFRSEILKKVGFFDEKIFMYLEDADITRRILNYSTTVYYPEVVIYHHHAALTHKSLKYKLITINSAIIYFNKWGWFKSLF